MTQALAIVPQAAPQSHAAALAPRSIAEVGTLAEMASKSGLYGVKNREEAFVRMMTGLELGLSAMQSLRGVYVINGRPTLAADLMVGVCKRRGDICKSFRLVESTDKIATYETERVGEGVTRMSFTIDQAKRAKLTGKETWVAHTEAMLRARASSLLARAVYSDILNGLYDPDEVDGLGAEPLRVVPEPVQVDVLEPAPPVLTDEQRKVVLDLCAAMFKAESLEQLRTVAQRIKASGLPETQMAELRQAYAARKADFAPAEPPTPSPAPVVVEAKPADDESTTCRHALLIRLDACSTVAGVGRLTEQARERQEAGVLSEEDLRTVFDAAKAVGERISRESYDRHHGEGRADQLCAPSLRTSPPCASTTSPSSVAMPPTSSARATSSAALLRWSKSVRTTFGKAGCSIARREATSDDCPDSLHCVRRTARSRRVLLWAPGVRFDALDSPTQGAPRGLRRGLRGRRAHGTRCRACGGVSRGPCVRLQRWAHPGRA
jgi:hypothetical protein